MALHKLDLAQYGVPREATAVMYTWNLDPNDAKAWLYRTQDDTEPVLLTGSVKIQTIGLVERQTLYFRVDREAGGFVKFEIDIHGHEAIEES